MTDGLIARRIDISGIVQGVGFRPFVYQLAKQYNMKGEVANTSSGVSLHIEGSREEIDSFCKNISEENPPLSQISHMSVYPDRFEGFEDFNITKSRNLSFKSTLISPDVAICNDCLRELYDPRDRRFRYPFINCINCGPRYTIIADVPYDRENTAMKSFEMCRSCQAEYDDPLNRRFHAQPNACAMCGPHIGLYDANRKPVQDQDIIERTGALLKQGHVVAVKGLGGFHLAVDAENDAAVAMLRERKGREEKPFAVMAFDVSCIRAFAFVEPEEEACLTSIQRPIVLLEKKEPIPLSREVSPDNRYLGVMLPYTPLHYLLLSCGFTALVMTSGNMSDEPIAIDNEEAFMRLSGIADYFLIHDRDIYLRSDDSIVKRACGHTRVIRRSRGYVPRPVFLKRAVPQILSCGAALKNTVCLTKDKTAFISQHIGDLENLAALQFFKSTIDHMKRILDITPGTIAYDLHPDYLSTRYALEQQDMKKVAVQHHHAHIVSCMAENMQEGPVIGLAFDGAGYGSDGKIWGGEMLIAEPAGFKRAAHLSYIPMPGSGKAIEEPWRMAVSYLYDTFGKGFWDLDLPVLKQIEEAKLEVVTQMISKKVNSPETSSLGRLFDGIASIIGIRNHVAFEGQAAMELEMLADRQMDTGYDFDRTGGETYILLFQPIVAGVVRDMAQGMCPSKISGKFHWTLVRMFTELCGVIRKETGLNRVALSGGVFQNTILLSGLVEKLEDAHFQVFSHRNVPTNDGGICLGQAVVAAAVEHPEVTDTHLR